jgi:hypothetical protein
VWQRYSIWEQKLQFTKNLRVGYAFGDKILGMVVTIQFRIFSLLFLSKTDVQNKREMGGACSTYVEGDK